MLESNHERFMRRALELARDKFRAAGFEVSGCVTTTRVGKASTGWKEVACCYTDKPTQDKLQSIFELAKELRSRAGMELARS